MRHLQRFISALWYACLSVATIYQYPYVDRLRHKRISLAMTLVEVLIVIAMVGTLAAIGVPAYNNYIDKTRNSQAIEDIRFIEAAIEMYRTSEGTLPETLDQVRSANLLDPWNRPYQYLKIEGKENKEIKGKYRHFLSEIPVNLDFDLYSMGKDGKSPPALTAQPSRDDIIRLDGGAYVGTITEY
jgi:general secretion pathway protein G